MNQLSAKLHTGSDTLNNVVSIYFIKVANLADVIIGNFHFRDIYSSFVYSLREYSITNSCVIQPYQSLSCRQLLRLNNIPFSNFRELVYQTNQVLESYTDLHVPIIIKHKSLGTAISAFLHTVNLTDDGDKALIKMHDKMYSNNDEFQDTKYNYFESILSAMKDAEVNQYSESKGYLIITKLLHLYTNFNRYMDTYLWKEKRKYLIGSKSRNKKEVLITYVKEMLFTDIYNDLSERDNESNIEFEADTLNSIGWFFTYLVYGSSKIHIMMIHSILGYKYKGAVMLYQKLFCKDRTTGKQHNFSYHHDFLHLSKESLYSERHIAGRLLLPTTEGEKQELDKYMREFSEFDFVTEQDGITIYDDSDCYNKIIYQTIINLMSTKS